MSYSERSNKMINKVFLILLFVLTGLLSSKAQTNERIVIDNDIELIHL